MIGSCTSQLDCDAPHVRPAAHPSPLGNPSLRIAAYGHYSPLGHHWGTLATVNGSRDSLPPQESRLSWDFEPDDTPRIVGDFQETHSECAGHRFESGVETTAPETLKNLEREGDSNPRPSAWESVQALVRFRRLVSASMYLIGSGDNSRVPQISTIVPLSPSVWLHFGYSAWRLFCSPRQERVELRHRLVAASRTASPGSATR